MLTIRRVDPDDARAMAAYARISKESELFENPYGTPFTFEEMREQFRNTDSTVDARGWLGYDERDEPVATAVTEFFLSDNTDKAFAHVDVLPAQRNRGYGVQLADHVLAEVRDAGRRQVMAGINSPTGSDETHPYRRFAEKRGFRFSQTEVHRVLDLPADDLLLDQLWADSEKRWDDYTLTDFEGLPPEEMREAYCVLLNQIIVDAPSGEIDFEEGRLTPETLAEREVVSNAAQRTTYVTVALDTDGIPVAHNVLVVPATDPGKIFNHDTMVLRSHRGHRLGFATKIQNLRRVAALHPERTTVHTWNAESNSWMIAVNDAMGFRPVMRGSEYVLDL
jgi:GNAT superfamily N-acetyltransferase